MTSLCLGMCSNGWSFQGKTCFWHTQAQIIGHSLARPIKYISIILSPESFWALSSINMSLIVILKPFHFLALFLAGGLGIGQVGLVVLWNTGFDLSYQIYGGMNLGWAFNVKLFGLQFFWAQWSSSMSMHRLRLRKSRVQIQKLWRV